MKYLLKLEFKRLLKSKFLYISILIGIALCTWLFFVELNEVINFNKQISLYGIDKAGLYYPRSLYNSFIGLEYAYLPSTILYTIFPLLVTIPFSISFFLDKKNGYLKNILINCNKKKYYIAKYITTFISGAFATAIILGFGLLISAMFFPALPPELTTSTFMPYDTTQMWVFLFITKPFLYIIFYSIIDILFYGLIATIPLSLSIWAKNDIFVLVAPILFFLILDYILNTLNLSSFSPIRFLRMCQLGIESNIIIIIIEALIILISTMYTFIYIGGKKDVI